MLCLLSMGVVLLQPLLTPTTWKAVNSLLPERANGSLASLCTWADDIKWMWKYHWTAPLHYIDTPDFLCRYDYDRNLSKLSSLSSTPCPLILSCCWARVDLVHDSQFAIVQATAMTSMVRKASVHRELLTISHLSWQIMNFPRRAGLF